jgi:hypothetical protein
MAVIGRLARFVLVPGLAAAGCSDKTQAHLERFLDTDVKKTEVKQEPIDPFELPQDPIVADKIHTMDYSEAARRLGPHRFQSKIRFEFESPETRASLREDDQIILARNGDFRVKVENDGGQGYEMVYSGGKLYARNRFGPYHPRPTLTEDHIRWRDAAYGGWRAIYRLYRGRLTFNKLNMIRYHGRDAIRFSVGLSGDKPRLPGTPDPPTVPAGVSKYVYPIQPTPSASHRWRDKARPKKASGTVLVDADCGAILKVEFAGFLQMPAPAVDNEESASGGVITVSVHVWHQTDGFGNPPSIAPPGKDSIQPIPERIQVDTHPIDFYFGKGYTASLGSPAGVAAKTRDEKEKKKKNEGGSASKP